LDDIIFQKKALIDEFDNYGFKRILLLFKDNPTNLDPKEDDFNIDSHAVVIAKVKGKWWLLDSAFEKPRCLST